MARLGLTGAALLTLTLAACGEAAPDPQPDSGAGEAVADGLSDARPTYEQMFVFANVTGDSTFLVPWIFSAAVGPDSVSREARGWLARSGSWDAFYAETWRTQTTREPSRILPFGDLRILVEEGDAVDGIVFEDGFRRLELAMEDVTSSWRGPRGETVALLNGAAFLSEERVDGLILHLARASSGSAPAGGDWAVLLSGDSVTMVMAAESEHDGSSEDGPLYRGWADVDGEELLWPELRVDWEETQAFPPARRDVPAEWRLWAPDGSVEGRVTAVASDIQSGEGPGPLLPVLALYEVVGEISTVEGDFEVRGLVVHERR